MARSGVAAVELLREKGAQRDGGGSEASGAEVAAGVQVEPQTEASFDGAELIVLSPGVPADLRFLEGARRRGVRVIGDLELASWFLKGEIIGITGSNGKTTTTALTGHILKQSGIPVQVGGNIGTPPAAMVKTSRAGQWNVLELSSFQLETTETFRAHIGAALNVTPDHLDRHDTLENYADAKGRLFANQTRGRFRGAERRRSDLRELRGRGHRRSRCGSARRAKSRPEHGCEGDEIVLNGDVADEDSPKFRLRGVHNLENTMAAAAMAQSGRRDARADSRGRDDVSGRRAPAGIRARARRRRLVQRFESHQRGRDAEGHRRV